MTNALTETLTCPKCNGPMRAYERNGVTIDQCAECRGIYLDRGELDRLIDAEAGYYQAAGRPNPSVTPPAHDSRPGYDARRDEKYRDSGYRDGGYREDKHRRKRGGFLGELFD